MHIFRRGVHYNHHIFWLFVFYDHEKWQSTGREVGGETAFETRDSAAKFLGVPVVEVVVIVVVVFSDLLLLTQGVP